MKKILLSLSLMVAPVSMYADALSTQILQNSESLQAAKLSLKGDELALRTEGNLPDPEIEMEIMALPEPSLELTVSETIEWLGVYQMRKKARECRIMLLNICLSQSAWRWLNKPDWHIWI